MNLQYKRSQKRVMPKIPTLSFKLVVIICALGCAFPVLSFVKKPVEPLSADHETLLKFIHQEEDGPRLYYWVEIEAEHTNANFTIAMNSLQDNIASIRTFIDEFTKSKNMGQYNKIELILKDPPKPSSAQEIYRAVSEYQLKLSNLDILFQNNYRVTQDIFIRLNDDRKILGEFVDQLQKSLLSQKNGMALTGFERVSEERFYHYNGIKHHKQEILQPLAESEEFIKKVHKSAEGQCKSLQMKLEAVISTTELFYSNYSNQSSQAPTQDELQNVEQMGFYEAHEKKFELQDLQFVKRVFEVKTKCTGNSPFIEKPFKNKMNEHQEGSEQEVNVGVDLADLEAQVQISRNKKIILN